MNILIKRSADCAGTCDELLEIGDYCRSHSDFIEIDAEDRFVVKERSDDLFNILCLTEPDLLHDRADSVRERIGRELEDLAVVIDAHHVAEPSGLYQGNELEVCYIEICGSVISLDSLAETDGQLLRVAIL